FGEEVALVRREQMFDRTIGESGRGARFVQVLETDEHLCTRVLQVERELLLLEHRVQRHDDRASLPRAKRGDHELRDVLKVERDAIARSNAAALEKRREPGRVAIE